MIEGKTKRRLALAAGGMLLLWGIVNASKIKEIWFTEEYIRSFGSMAPLAFCAMFACAVILAVPGGPITILAGSLFGICQGTVVVSIGSTLGAAIAFLIARYVSRDHVSRWLMKNPKFAKLDTMIQKHGFIAIAIVRLIPLFPFNLINYGMGLTSISFGYYVFMSWLCMLPGTLLYITGGDVLRKIMTEQEIPCLAIVIFAVVVTLLSTVALFSKKITGKRQNI